MNEAYFKARAALQARRAGRMGDYAEYLREQADGYEALQRLRAKIFGIDDNPIHPLPIDSGPVEFEVPDAESRLRNMMYEPSGAGRSGRLMHPTPGTPEFLEYAGVYGEPVIEVFTPGPNGESYTLEPISGKTGKPITERGAKRLKTQHEKMLAAKRGPIHTSVESHTWSDK